MTKYVINSAGTVTKTFKNYRVTNASEKYGWNARLITKRLEPEDPRVPRKPRLTGSQDKPDVVDPVDQKVCFGVVNLSETE